jgi:hypothetical protein
MDSIAPPLNLHTIPDNDKAKTGLDIFANVLKIMKYTLLKKRKGTLK